MFINMTLLIFNYRNVTHSVYYLVNMKGESTIKTSIIRVITCLYIYLYKIYLLFCISKQGNII